jgi:hypothetical protein
MQQALIVLTGQQVLQPEGIRAVQAATAVCLAWGGVAFIAYHDAHHGTQLRKVLSAPLPRFFPQAARPVLGERFTQAFAYAFIQGFERIVLMSKPVADLQVGDITRWFGALESGAVHLEEANGAIVIGMRREEFPSVGAVIEGIAWDKAGARDEALRMLSLIEMQR